MLGRCTCASQPESQDFICVPTWKYDPAFGIIHTSGCKVCISYIKHVASASQLDADEVSFHLAVKEKESQAYLRYLNGISEGIRLLEEDSPPETLGQHRAEHAEVVEMLNLRTTQLATAEKELSQVKEQFQTLQHLFNDIVCVPNGVPSLVRADTAENLPICKDSVHVVHAEVARNDDCAIGTPSALPTPPSSPLPQSTLDVLPLSPSSTLQSPSSTLLFGDASTEDLKPTTPTPPYSLQGLVALISEALKGSWTACESLDVLYSVAQSTPQSGRTPAQQLVLLEWIPRRPSRSGSSCTVSTPFRSSELPTRFPCLPCPSNQDQINNPGKVVEIYVDSSGWGIGFSLEGRWLAWKLRRGWNVDGRDNNWAEMIAIELGLLVFISSGLHLRHKTVIVRSDNSGVVQSLIKGRSKHPRQPEVIQRIMKMEKQYHVNVDVRWVPTKKNLADKISRGTFPPQALRLHVADVLPEHLQPFLVAV